MRTVRIYEYKEKEVPRPHQNLQVTSHSFNIAPSEDISTDDIKKLEQLTIAPKYLYVDALNFGGRFFTRGGSHWTVVRAVNRIKKFIEAATNSGWQLKVFIDAATKSGEAMSKWRRRREAEVKKENREIPQGMNIIFGDAFRENGIEVFYSVEADNDDTLAAYASQDQAAILSGDKDFFRYRGLKCPLYGDFEIRKRRLYLYELKPNDKPIPKRNIISPPPTITDKDPSLVNLADNFYLRGAPSALVKRIGNIHITCRPLRQAVYSRRGVKTAVREIFPIWQEDRVFWLEEEVVPDPKLDHLLDNPTEALETFFPKLTLVKPDGVSNLDWENHLYAMHAVIFELCALGSKDGVSFLQMILSVAAKPTEKPQNQEKFQKRWEKKPPKASIPAYETICVVCESTVILFERDVLFFQSKGFDMPKRCKGCRQAKHKK